MTKKVYIKDTKFDPIYKEVSKGFVTRTTVMPTILLFSGLFVLATQVILPLLVFKTHNESIEIIDNATVLGRAAGFYEFEFEELEDTQKAQKLSKEGRKQLSVFQKNPLYTEEEYVPSAENDQPVLSGRYANVPEYFYISIPKLKIENAVVETNATSLNPVSALGHYPGTALPGENGNSFIFGHSVLPWFFNPKNYKTIFSTLGKLQPGDEFFVTYNNREFKYIIENTEELPPNEVNPLASIKPAYLNESTMVLMTCSPPGTKLRRLLVNAVLKN